MELLLHGVVTIHSSAMINASGLDPRSISLSMTIRQQLKPGGQEA